MRNQPKNSWIIQDVRARLVAGRFCHRMLWPGNFLGDSITGLSVSLESSKGGGNWLLGFSGDLAWGRDGELV